MRRGYLKSAAPLVAQGGEIHVTLVHRYPYTAWLHAISSDAPLLRDAGLTYLGAADFDFTDYPGYRHQATTHIEGGALDVVTRCLTHAWCRRVHSATVTGSDDRVHEWQ